MSDLQSQPRITPFLWFDQNAEEAVDFYLSVFKNSRRVSELRNIADAPVPKGSVLVVSFELDGQRFTALNGGPAFHFNESISFVVRCDSQQEVNDYWSKLTADGGSESQCGWLRDKFGLSWQIVPARLQQLLKHPKAMQAMMGMKKLDLAELERAAQS
ncbi:MAG: VOC family protein [Acidobacteriaceae bacterium]|jgi:predicted 3-demethylubiquinone-9 3-methyltransferase (glyoxalase superfamily)